MTSFLRIGLFLALIAGVVAMGRHVEAISAADVANDVAQLPQAQDEIERQAERGANLDERLNESKARFAMKNQVAADLAAGRLTLAAAAARFRETLVAVPAGWDYLRLYGQGRTEEERLCRYVITWTRNTLQKDPSKSAEVCSRLEKELAEHLAEDRF